MTTEAPARGVEDRGGLFPTRWQMALTALTLLVGVILGATPFGREDPVATPRSTGSAEDAVFTDLVGDRVATGGYSIALVYAQTEDLRLRRTSDVVELDGLHAFSLSYNGGEAVAVVEVVDGRFTEYLVTAP